MQSVLVLCSQALEMSMQTHLALFRLCVLCSCTDKHLHARAIGWWILARKIPMIPIVARCMHGALLHASGLVLLVKHVITP